MSSVIVSLIGALATIFCVWYKSYLDKTIGKKDKVACSLPVVGLLGTYGVLDSIRSISNNIFQETSADRFLLLVSEKQESAHTYISVVHEEHAYSDSNVRLSIGATSKYLKIETDQAYRKMLEELKEEKVLRYNVASMPYGMLREIYKSEMITHSNIYYLYEFKYMMEGDEKECLLFASVATHKGIEFTQIEELKIKMGVDKIKNEILPKKS